MGGGTSPLPWLSHQHPAAPSSHHLGDHLGDHGGSPVAQGWGQSPGWVSVCVGGDGGTDGRVEGGQMDGSVGGRREGRRGGWMDRGRDGRTDGWVGGQLDGRKEGRTDSRMGGWRDRQMGRCAEERPPCLLPRPSLSPLPMGHRAPVPTGRAGADPGQCPIPADTAPTLPRRGDGAAGGGWGGGRVGSARPPPGPQSGPGQLDPSCNGWCWWNPIMCPGSVRVL